MYNYNNPCHETDPSDFVGMDIIDVRENCNYHVCIIEHDSKLQSVDLLPGLLYVCLEDNIVKEAWFQK